MDGREALTPRQREVLALVLDGFSNPEIAEALGISVQGVKWHIGELLGRYNVANRNELMALVAGRQPASHRRQSSGWLAGLFVSKVAVWAVAGTAAIGIAAAALAVARAYDRTPETAGPASPTAVAAVATATLPPGVMDDAPGAIWSPAEAYTHALAEAQRLIDARVSTPPPPAVPGAPPLGNRQDLLPLDARTLSVAEAAWLPQVTRWDAPDGDRYWTADGPAIDAWLFRWEQPGIAMGPDAHFPVGTLSITVLLEDGADTVGSWLEVQDPAGASFGGGSLRSRAAEEQIARMAPAGPQIHVAWLNNVPGGIELVAYPLAGGGWCTRTISADPGHPGGGDCPFGNSLGPSAKMHFSRSSRYTPGDDFTDPTVLALTARPEVVRVAVEHPDGRRLEFDTQPMPSEIGDGRVAVFDIGQTFESFVVIAYDAAGNEIARE